jgi:hypothetical protein
MAEPRYRKSSAPCSKCGELGHGTRNRRAGLPERCGNRCGYCADLPHRREQPVCIGCGKPWEPEVLVHELPAPRSGCHGF